MNSLSNKHILITGATGYLGNQLAFGLAELGANIHVNSRTRDACERLVHDIKASGLSAVLASFDVTNEEEVNKYVKSISQLDVLINNSYAGLGGTVLTASMDMYIDSYKSSVVASANLIKALEPKLSEAVKRTGNASIINVASMYGMVSPDPRIYDTDEGTNPPFYGASKAALIQLTKYAACELAPKNIRVNCVSPGPFPSKKSQTELPDLMHKIAAKVPLGRIGLPHELVGPIAFLASDASSFVTGVNIPVDGGWTCW
jgi:NAD(P)-dependent dehydrogenase (short-subunit alcohol dehydrogenase family)|tara:strand:- start:1016 stop:1792 length:777 start_codon:yes stop_codon:yes gene_type:complete